MVKEMKFVPDISIIIPVYNVGQYLDKCIKSVINQTHKDIEIIFYRVIQKHLDKLTKNRYKLDTI